MVVAARKKQSLFISEPTKQEIVSQELEQIRWQNGGILQPDKVVESAEPDDSPLHKYFEWNDTDAAYQYRIWQARQLISAVVVILPNTKRPINAYVSMRDDRMNPAGGYRALVEVLSNEEQRELLLHEALQDLRHFERKYKRLIELSPIFDAINRVGHIKVESVPAKRARAQ